jgi:cytosine deaminase
MLRCGSISHGDIMSFDLIVTGGTLADGRRADIGISGDRIAAIEPGIEADAGGIVDASGCLVSPPFVDPHFHMDATLSYGKPRINATGTLLEGIALWGELKPLLTQEAVKERALAYCDWAVSMGLLAIRTHVDTCDDRLLAVEALLEVKKAVAPFIDLQLVAFPQDGFYRDPTARQNTIRALDMGVDVVGGIPHFERTMADGTRSVTELCEIAAKRGLMVDMHCDETDDPLSRHIEQLSCETQRLGLQGRVAGSHLTSMHSMDNYYVSKLLPLMAEAQVSAIPNPLINIVLQGHHDTYPKRRGLTRVPEMLRHGIRVGFGQDCVLDPWYSLGTADMLDVAFMGLHVAQMTSPADMRRCLDMVTSESAAIMGLADYGLAVGKKASLVVLDAGDPVEAIRLRAARLAVVAAGKVVSRRDRAHAKVTFAGREVEVSRRFVP